MSTGECLQQQQQWDLGMRSKEKGGAIGFVKSIQRGGDFIPEGTATRIIVVDMLQSWSCP